MSAPQFHGNDDADKFWLDPGRSGLTKKETGGENSQHTHQPTKTTTRATDTRASRRIEHPCKKPQLTV